MNRTLGCQIWAIVGFLAVVVVTPVASAEPAPEEQGVASMSPAGPPPEPPAPTVASQPAPVAAPAPAPAVPPGYMLVPIAPPPSGYGTPTRYDVQYPQARGALPPGMELPYRDGDPIPPGYRVIEQKRRGLIIAGSLTAGVPWALGVAAAAGANFEDKTGWLVVPVLGPWLMIAAGGANEDRSCGSFDTDESDCYDNNAALRGVLALDGLVQAAGAVMFACGMTIPRKRLIREDVTVSMLPSRVGRDGYGMGLVGSF